MKAIETRYIGPSNTRGARMVADDGAGNRVTIPYDYAVSRDQVHADACRALLDKMKWQGELISGSTRRGMVWVFIDEFSQRVKR